MSDEVDLVVVADHKHAEKICEALTHAGIHHVDFWPEQMLRPSRAYSDSPLAHGFFRAKKVPDEGFGPFHIRVREEDLAQARLVLSSSGLAAS